jgi:replicative DNA helicase
MANTGHYKTGFMSCWARRVADRIPAREADQPGEMIVYVSWETAVEELGAMDFARTTGLSGAHIWHDALDLEEMQALQGAAKGRERLPMWVIGHSITRRHKRLPLTLARLTQALDAVEGTHQLTPALIFLDHLQEMDAGKGADMRERTLNNVEGAKQLARDLACPVVLGVQAKRDCLEREWKLPDLGDGQETSRIEQVADKMLALWLPGKTETPGETLSTGWTVSDSLLVLGIRKQRFGQSGNMVPLHVNFETNEIGAMTTQRMDWG